jgi:hypothetical protein
MQWLSHKNPVNNALRSKLPVYVVWLPFVAYFCAAFLTFIVVEEDAFIYFRIAQNMADGYGIVFNRGGEHIESGSGLTWQLMLALLAMLPVHLVMATKFLGVLFACLSLWKLLQLSDRFIEDKRFVVFPALLLAVSTPFYYWSHRGLETPLFVFALLWLFDVLTGKQKIRYWFIPAFWVFCSRPEGFLMVAAVMPWLWMERKIIAGFWKGIAIFGLLCVMLSGWRLYYFHDLLPHAFYQKIGGDAASSLHDLLQYGLWNGLWLLGLLALPAMLVKQNWHRPYIPLLLLLAVTMFWGVVGADWKSFNRQLSSWLPFYFLLVFAMISRSEFRAHGARIMLACVSLYAALLCVFSPYTATNGAVMWSPVYGTSQLFFNDPFKYASNVVAATINPEGYFTETGPTLAGDHIGFNRNATVGRFIKQNYPAGITVIFDQMGQETWYAGQDKQFIDNTGLTDKMIGYHVFHEKAEKNTIFHLYENMIVAIKHVFWPEEKFDHTKAEIVDRIFAAKPELVLIREKYLGNQPNSIISLVCHDARFANYRRAWRINKRDTVYERRDLPVLLDPVVPPGALVESAGNDRP